MAFDPNLNVIGASGGMMNNESSLELPDWCQNEESVDIANFMSSNRNLELCDDELFETLFPPTSPPVAEPGKDKNDKEVEQWYYAPHDILPTSACSSTSTSPALQNYYHTPPVTPRSDPLRISSPHHLQFEGLTTPMSSARLASLRIMNPHQPNQTTTLNPHLPSQNPNVNSHLPNQTTNVNPHSPIQNPNVNSHIPNPSLPDTQDFVNPVARVKQEVEHQTFAPMMVSTNSATKPRGEPNSEFHTDFVSQASSSNVQGVAATKRTRVSSFHLASKKTKFPDKGSLEYFEKRKRNNVAVRRSRDKAKLKAVETQHRVSELSNENTALRRRVAELSHELNTLKGLLTSMPQHNFRNM